MEHIAEDEAVFAHFERVLRPGGHVIINTPSDRGGSDVQAEGDESFIGEHVREGYARDQLAEKLRRAGLELAKGLYTYGPYGSAAWRGLIKWPMQLLGATWASVVLLPLYYIAALPLGLLLNAADVQRTNKEGTGLFMVARRPRRPA